MHAIGLALEDANRSARQAPHKVRQWIPHFTDRKVPEYPLFFQE